MTLSLDHVIVSVNDLQTAIETYRSVGFVVNYGGKHADGVTENALIVFQDGTYIELIALVEGRTRDEANFKQLLKETGEGFTGYALLSDNIEADLASLKQRGANVGQIQQGSRQTPDGQILQWEMAPIDHQMSPFIIQDVSDRSLRVKTTPENVTHTNGASGIHEILIEVSNLREAAQHYGDDVSAPLAQYKSLRFEVGDSAIVLHSVKGGTMEPYTLTLHTNRTTRNPYTLHGANVLFI